MSQPYNKGGRIHFHQMRKLATSIAFSRGLSIKEVGQRAMRGSEDVFFKNYLTLVKEKLPPIIALGYRIS